MSGFFSTLYRGLRYIGVRYIGVLCHTFYYYWAEEYRSLYRGLRYIGVRYIGVLCHTFYYYWAEESGAPNDGFLSNALKRCFRLSGMLLKLCRLILGSAIKFLSVRSF